MSLRRLMNTTVYSETNHRLSSKHGVARLYVSLRFKQWLKRSRQGAGSKGCRGSTLGAAWRGVSGSAVKADLVEECREGELDAVRGGAVSKSGAG